MMTDNTSVTNFQRASLIFALREIIDALDRRGPQVERGGEMRIAQDALALRGQAVARLEELERVHGDQDDDIRVETVVTNKGGS
jgi:hypothetical protein